MCAMLHASLHSMSTGAEVVILNMPFASSSQTPTGADRACKETSGRDAKAGCSSQAPELQKFVHAPS
jgi:hypothetical protein